MREIKFRAWDKKRKHYLGSAEYVIDPYDGQVAEMVSYDPYYDKLSVNHDAILQQYTGMDDKNGKRIYEGDIVKFTGLFGYEFTGQVVYEKFCFNLKDFYCGGFDYPTLAFSEYDPNKFEVIGNIHENQELVS